MQGRIEAASLSQLMVQNIQEKSLLSAKEISTEDKASQLRLELAGSEIARQLAAAENSSAEALNRLSSGVCSMD